jgi:hypothetical protein
VQRILVGLLIVYVGINLVINALVVDAIGIEFALVHILSAQGLQTISEAVAVFGLSLLCARFYITSRPDPERITRGRLSACAAIVAVAFLVLMPAQQSLVNRIVTGTDAETRRTALVLGVTNYGLLSGDVIIPELGLDRESLDFHDVRVQFPFLGIVLLLGDGFEVLEQDFQPIMRTVLINSSARHYETLTPAFNAAMTASCTHINALFADYEAASQRIERAFRTTGDRTDVREAWWRQMDGLIGEGADVLPDQARDIFLRNPAVRAKLHEDVGAELGRMSLPEIFHGFAAHEKGPLDRYVRARMAERIADPCDMTWRRFVREGHRDAVAADLAAYYGRLISDDRYRLGENGDLAGVGRGAVVAAIGPFIGVTLTLGVALVQAGVILSLVSRNYVPWRHWGAGLHPKRMQRLTVAIATAGILFIAVLVPSEAESNPEWQERIHSIAATHQTWGAPVTAALRVGMRLEALAYPVGQALKSITPLDELDVFGGPVERGAKEGSNG